MKEIPARPGYVLHMITVGPNHGSFKFPDGMFIRWLDGDQNSQHRAALVWLPAGSRPLPADDLDDGPTQRLYESTGNPFYAWSVYRRCRLAGAPLPAWVLHYFDGASLALEAAVVHAGGHTDPSRAVADALGFRSKPGRGNFASELLDGRAMEIGREVHELRQDIAKKKEAVRSVAERHGMSESTVRDYYERWLKKKRAIDGTEAEPAGKVVPLKKPD